MQAERKSSTSTHIPDLDNANVGTDVNCLRKVPWHFPLFRIIGSSASLFICKENDIAIPM